MKKTIFAATAAAMSLVSLPVFAQSATETAMEAAIRRAICGADVRPLAAEWLDDGRLRVVCRPGAAVPGTGAAAATAAAGGGTATGAGVLAGTVLTTEASIALVAAAATVLVATGGGDDGTVVTTTTTTSP